MFRIHFETEALEVARSSLVSEGPNVIAKELRYGWWGVGVGVDPRLSGEQPIGSLASSAMGQSLARSDSHTWLPSA